MSVIIPMSLPNNDYTVCINRETQTSFFCIRSPRCFFNTRPVLRNNYLQGTFGVNLKNLLHFHIVFRNLSQGVMGADASASMIKISAPL